MEKANHTAAQRWWRTLADEVSPAQAQTGLDRFCVRVGDARPRRRVDGTATTVAGLAADEALRPMPTAPFPAVLSADAQISAQALVCFRGNSYSVGRGWPAASRSPLGSAGGPPSTSSPRAGWCWPGTAANPTRPAR